MRRALSVWPVGQKGALKAGDFRHAEFLLDACRPGTRIVQGKLTRYSFQCLSPKIPEELITVGRKEFLGIEELVHLWGILSQEVRDSLLRYAGNTNRMLRATILPEPGGKKNHWIIKFWQTSPETSLCVLWTAEWKTAFTNIAVSPQLPLSVAPELFCLSLWFRALCCTRNIFFFHSPFPRLFRIMQWGYDRMHLKSMWQSLHISLHPK